MSTIIIGRKQLFSFAERYSSRRLGDYSGLADGDVLCCLFNLVFPELRIRLAAPQTHSSTQRSHLNWEQLFRRFARLRIPLAFLQPTALQENNVECGFSSLVLFYFLYHLSKRADFSAEFALDVRDEVTAYLQSTDCIVSLLLGKALSWSAIPPTLVQTVQSHPGFQLSQRDVGEAEAAAAEFYRSKFTKTRLCRNTSHSNSNSAGDQKQRRIRTSARTTAASDGDGEEIKDTRMQSDRPSAAPRAQTTQGTLVVQQARHNNTTLSSMPAVAGKQMQREQLHTTDENTGQGDGGSCRSSGEYDASPAPRAPSNRLSAHSVRSTQVRQQRQQKEQSQKYSGNDSCSGSATRVSSSAASASALSSPSLSRSSSRTLHAPVNDFDSSLEISGMEGNDSSTTKPDVSRRLLPKAKIKEEGGDEDSKEGQFVRRSASVSSAKLFPSSSCASSSQLASTKTSSPTSSLQCLQHSERGTDVLQQQQPYQQRSGRYDEKENSQSNSSRRRESLLEQAKYSPQGSSAFTCTAYRAASSVAPRSSTRPASLNRTGASSETAPHLSAAAITTTSGNSREEALEAALRLKEEECEDLQLRVAQLLSLLANVKATAVPTSSSSSPPLQSPSPNARTSPTTLVSARTAQQNTRRSAELEGQVGTEESRCASSPFSPVKQDDNASAATTTAVQAEIEALTADILDEETGAPIDVNETANLLHCLLLEHLHDSPRNREQMQQWLWSVVAAHHTLEGRLLAAVELIRALSRKAEQNNQQQHRAQSNSSSSVQVPQHESNSCSRESGTIAQPRSRSTVTAPFASAATSLFSSSAAVDSKNDMEVNRKDNVDCVHNAFYAELEALHDKEHRLMADLRVAQAKCAKTVQRAVRRERLWKQLCAEVYAAEQASFAILDCETTEEVETRLQTRDVHYANVESYTQQLVEDSAAGQEEASIDFTTEQMSDTPCASLQTLVARLKEERTELLGDVARLHALLAVVQHERTHATERAKGRKQGNASFISVMEKANEDARSCTQRANPPPSSASHQLSAPPAFRSLFHPTASSTKPGTEHINTLNSGAVSSLHSHTVGIRGPDGYRESLRAPRGLSSLLQEDAAVYRVV